jgi:hypothetical protein
VGANGGRNRRNGPLSAQMGYILYPLRGARFPELFIFA